MAADGGIQMAGQRPDVVADLRPSPPAVTVAPRYSVVIPALNEERYLGACLSSLANQDYPGDFEVIVVDNNSTDRTAAVARDQGATVVFEREPGVCAARQRGTEVARGEIIISTDADTTFDPTWLSNIDRSFTRDPSHVAVAGPCHFVSAPRWGTAYERMLFGLVHLIHRVTGRVMYISATNIAFRKSAWTGYDSRLTQGGDELDLLRQLRIQGTVAFDLRNPTHTSSRRMNQGLIYNVAVTFFFYYFLGYALNRLFGRSILGMYPAFRNTRPPRTAGWTLRRVVIVTGTGLLIATAFVGWLLVDGVDIA